LFWFVSALLDTKDATVRGGTGKAFDWSLAAALAAQAPFFLAGGLSPNNVAHAVRSVQPFALDVSSGVETDKQKDLEKILEFVTAAKTLENGLIQ
jgi:phosphoribosylanthranilate isomerase